MVRPLREVDAGGIDAGGGTGSFIGGGGEGTGGATVGTGGGEAGGVEAGTLSWLLDDGDGDSQ